LAYGIAPQTIRSFLLQRLRWAQGTMQLYRSKESPLWVRGLSWKQRLSYLSSFLAYFESFQKIVLISIPIFILGFDVFPMRVNLLSFLLHWAPYFALNILANQVGGRGVFQYFKTEKYNILKTIIFIESTFTLLSRKQLKFKVTPKKVDDTVYQQERRSMRWYMAIFGSLIGSMIYAITKIFLPHTHVLTWDAFFIAFFWAGYNAYVILSALKEVFNKKHERKQYRFPIHAEGKVYGAGAHRPFINVQVTDLSIAGAGILLDEEIPPTATNMLLRIFPAGFKDILIPIGTIHYQRKLASGKIFAGSSFSEDLGPQRDRLFEYLFVQLPHVDVNAHDLYRVNEWDPFRLIQEFYPRALAFIRSSVRS
jgi:cellulose synthase (UDP-forming)